MTRILNTNNQEEEANFISIFNKQSLLQHLKDLPFPKKEYWVVAGGAMVLHGFRLQTRDIDLGCSSLLADKLERQGYVVSRCEDGTRKISYSEDIEIFENWIEGTIEIISGAPVVSVDGLIQMKKKLGRKKDLADIELIEQMREPVRSIDPCLHEPNMKTLYVSDLDGTLLRSNQKTSVYTNRIINELVEKGMLFSYATARSSVTAQKVTEGMTASFPLIVYNGAFIKNNSTGELLLENLFIKDEAVRLIEELSAGGISPIVYSFIDGAEKFSYVADEISHATRDFVKTRKSDPRERVIDDVRGLLDGDIFYLTCIDEPEKLEPFYEKYKDKYHCVYQRDIYSGEQWFEIMPKDATKANAVRHLATLLGCDHIVVFGDGINDIDMFEIADEAYAVENAVPELKAIATAVIDSNDNDGVAKWLSERIRKDST